MVKGSHYYMLLMGIHNVVYVQEDLYHMHTSFCAVYSWSKPNPLDQNTQVMIIKHLYWECTFRVTAVLGHSPSSVCISRWPALANALLPCGCTPLAGPISHCLSERTTKLHMQWYSLNLMSLGEGRGGWLGWGGEGWGVGVGWGGEGGWVGVGWVGIGRESGWGRGDRHKEGEGD